MLPSKPSVRVVRPLRDDRHDLLRLLFVEETQGHHRRHLAGKLVVLEFEPRGRVIPAEGHDVGDPMRWPRRFQAPEDRLVIVLVGRKLLDLVQNDDAANVALIGSIEIGYFLRDGLFGRRRPSGPDGVEKSGRRTLRHRFPIMIRDGRNLRREQRRQACAQQRGFAGARFAHQDNQPHPVVEYPVEQRGGFSLPAKAAEQVGVVWSERQRPLEGAGPDGVLSFGRRRQHFPEAKL